MTPRSELSVEYPRLTRSFLRNDVEKYGWTIGKHTYGKPRILERVSKLSIGNFCSIGENCVISLGNHRLDAVSTYPFSTLKSWWPNAAGLIDHDSKGDVLIGNDVWIGDGVFIGSGVTIGDGAVIAARSVVTRNVKQYSIVGGSPAKC